MNIQKFIHDQLTTFNVFKVLDGWQTGVDREQTLIRQVYLSNTKDNYVITKMGGNRQCLVSRNCSTSNTTWGKGALPIKD